MHLDVRSPRNKLQHSASDVPLVTAAQGRKRAAELEETKEKNFQLATLLLKEREAGKKQAARAHQAEGVLRIWEQHKHKVHGSAPCTATACPCHCNC